MQENRVSSDGYATVSGDVPPRAMLGGVRPAGNARWRICLGNAENCALHKTTDSQHGSERPQSRDAICVR
jgi:hypothetical protein